MVTTFEPIVVVKEQPDHTVDVLGGTRPVIIEVGIPGPQGPPGSSSSLIQEDGVAQPERTALNFVSTAEIVPVVDDDPIGDRTNVGFDLVPGALDDFVTIATDQDVTGRKTFTNAFFLNNPWTDLDRFPGVDPTGATDSTAGVLAAYNAGYRKLRFGDGDYLINDLVLQGRGYLQIAGRGMGRTRIIQGAGHTFRLRGGSRGAIVATTLTATAPANDQVIVVANPLGIVPGMFLNIRSNKAWPGTDKGAVVGELIRVASVTGSIVTLEAPLEETYDLADLPVVEDLPMMNGLDVTDLTIENLTPLAASAVGVGIEARFARRVTTSRIRHIRGDSAGQVFFACQEVLGENAHFDRMSDDDNHLGYGFLTFECTRDATFRNSYMMGGRHLYTCGSFANPLAPPPDGVPLGVPRHVIVSDCVASEMVRACFDTHFEGTDHIFSNCHVHNTMGPGFQVRAKQVTLINPTVDSAVGHGILVRENADGYSILGGKITNILTGTLAGTTGLTQGQGIRLADIVAGTQIVGPGVIDGTTVEDTDANTIQVGGGAAAQIMKNLTLRRPGRLFPELPANRSGISFVGTSANHFIHNLIVDNALNGLNGGATITGVRVDGYITTGLGGALVGGGMVVGYTGFYGLIGGTTRPAALTAATASTIDTAYGAEERDTIINLRTRLNELEARLRAIGLLT